MKVLAFNPDLEKLNVLEKNYRPYQVLLFHHHRGNLEITHSDAQKELH